MGIPTLKLMFDRRKRASKTKEGAIELRIGYDRKKKYATTGVRVFPREWRNGYIVHRLDAAELQRTLDVYVANARKIINDLMERGEFDMDSIVAQINGRQKKDAAKNVVKERFLLDYFRERAEIRKYGRSSDSCERYERFLRWFEEWDGMRFFSDINEANILAMDKTLSAMGMKPYSKWNNYHRFLNSFILDANDDGLMQGNPYKKLNVTTNTTNNYAGCCKADEQATQEINAVATGNGNVAGNNNVVGSVTIGAAILQERVTMLEKLLEEKERTIKILMGK